jgi:hypothetical protein
MTCIHEAESRQGAGRQFLGKCYLKSFQILIPKFYKQIHDLLKVQEDPLGLVKKIRGLNLNGFEEHPSTPGRKGQLWYLLPWTKEWAMSLEQVLKAYRASVSDPVPIKVYLQLKPDHGHLRRLLLMTTQDAILYSHRKCCQL